MAEVIFFHKPSTTALSIDSIQRHVTQVFYGCLLKMDGMGGEKDSTPEEWCFLLWVTGRLPKAREIVDHILNGWAPDKNDHTTR